MLLRSLFLYDNIKEQKQRGVSMDELGYNSDGEPTEKQIEFQDTLDSLVSEYLISLESVLIEYQLKQTKTTAQYDMSITEKINSIGLNHFGLSFDDVY